MIPNFFGGQRVAVVDGSMGFWKAISKVFPHCRHQRCWVHKMANILNKLSNPVQLKIKPALQDIWMAETRSDAYKAFDNSLERFGAKYTKASEYPSRIRLEYKPCFWIIQRKDGTLLKTPL